MLSKYIEKTSKLYKNIDGLAVVDKRGIICHYVCHRPDISKLTEDIVLNKHVTEVWPDLDENTSTLLTVLRTGEPIINNFQEYTNCAGVRIKAINTTMPLNNSEGDIIGAIDVSVYVDNKEKTLSLAMNDSFRPQKLFTIDDIITQDPVMIELKQNISHVAMTNSSVLIYGETGTGKELVAQSIHSASRRSGKPFVVQNCAAIPNTLLESLLFGTVKGSYTGAENRKGLFELADGGSLFLDEINTMGVDTQSKILKAIEEKKIMRVGGTESVPVDVRVIAAVNVNPKECLRNGTLREDLYYRLRVVELRLPPLRERKGDIPALTEYFIKYFNSTMGRYIAGISNELKKEIMEYDWPGNVRELRNVIERGFNMAVTPIIESRDVDLFDRIEPARRLYCFPTKSQTDIST